MSKQKQITVRDACDSLYQEIGHHPLVRTIGIREFHDPSKIDEIVVYLVKKRGSAKLCADRYWGFPVEKKVIGPIMMAGGKWVMH